MKTDYQIRTVRTGKAADEASKPAAQGEEVYDPGLDGEDEPETLAPSKEQLRRDVFWENER